MTEDALLNIAEWIYMPSVLVFLFIIFAAFFLEIWLPSLYGAKRALAWFAITVLTLTVFIATLIWSFSMGGCFENCSGKKDDEIGLIVAGTANWIYILFLFFICADIHKKCMKIFLDFIEKMKIKGRC